MESATQIWAEICVANDLGFELPAYIPISGAHNPAMRLKKLATPVPVPRLGAGKTSGVYLMSFVSFMLFEEAG